MDAVMGFSLNYKSECSKGGILEKYMCLMRKGAN